MWDFRCISYAIVSGFKYVTEATSYCLCRVDCSTNYHHNFSVSADFHTYYGGVPDLIQVGEHQFIEKRVVNLFIGMMLIAWCMPRQPLWFLSMMFIPGHLQQMLPEYIITVSPNMTTSSMWIVLVLSQKTLPKLKFQAYDLNMCGTASPFCRFWKATSPKSSYLFLMEVARSYGSMMQFQLKISL